MPYISSSGKPRPQSAITMSSPYSYTVIFLPTSPRPPNGIIFNFGDGNLKFFILGALALVLILFIIIYKIAFKSYDFYDGNDEAIYVSFKEI